MESCFFSQLSRYQSIILLKVLLISGIVDPLKNMMFSMPTTHEGGLNFGGSLLFLENLANKSSKVLRGKLYFII